MAKFYYKAVHSSGAVHLRASASTGGYKFCVANSHLSSASFSSRLDLAQKEQSQRAKYGTLAEILPAVEITSAEHAQLTKANQISSTVTFRGKKFSKSRTVSEQAIVAIVGLYKAACEKRFPLDENASAQARALWPDGFSVYQEREYFQVHAYCDLARAQKEAADRNNQGYTTELFEIVNG